MPYKDKEKQKEYQREWVAKRRASWLSDKSCVICGSIDRLEIDHIDPANKWKHNFWSYSWDRIHAELEKCQVLCWVHHNEKTADQNNIPKAYTHGTKAMWTEHKCRCDKCNDWYESIGRERTKLAVRRYRARKTVMAP